MRSKLDFALFGVREEDKASIYFSMTRLQTILVVKSLPERLREFSGKTIVFDGTLITCHYHFSQYPHEYRHILGWYRIITELRSSNVNAICVFDGVARSAGKALENARRQNNRRLGLARWSLEVKRQDRLEVLYELLKKARAVPFAQRGPFLSKIKDLVRERHEMLGEKRPVVYADSATDPVDVVQDELTVDLGATSGEHLVIPEIGEDEYTSETESVAWIDESFIQDEEFLYEDQRLPPSIQYDKDAEVAIVSSETLQNVTPLIDFSSDLPEDALETSRQMLLTADEGRIWRKVQRMLEAPWFCRIPGSLPLVLERSRTMCKNFERQARPPTKETYRECRMILEAMGVPCIEVSGPYEAEGLAAALVRRGLADFVGSEDTDVLVYGAPLLRYLPTRSEPICYLSPSEVRRALRLSRAAFIDFALLTGTDFVPRVKNIGPVRALNYITAHSRIERVVTKERRYLPKDLPDYLERVRVARKIFNTLPPVPPRERLRPGELNKERVTEILACFGLSRAAEDADWDPQASLAGNYFGDDPTD